MHSDWADALAYIMANQDGKSPADRALDDAFRTGLGGWLAIDPSWHSPPVKLPYTINEVDKAEVNVAECECGQKHIWWASDQHADYCPVAIFGLQKEKKW